MTNAPHSDGQKRKRRLELNQLGDALPNADDDNIDANTEQDRHEDDELNSPPPFPADDDNDENDDLLESSEGEDLFDDNLAKDYKEMPHLDQYDARHVDDNIYEEMSIDDRRRIDAELDRRDISYARAQGRIPSAFLPEVPIDSTFKGLTSKRAQKHVSFEEKEFAQDKDDEYDEDLLVDDESNEMATAETLTEAEAAGYSLVEFVQLDNFRRRIIKEFIRFLREFVDESGNSVYYSKIRAMCSSNRESLEVSFMHLLDHNALLANLISHAPSNSLALFDEAAKKVTLQQFEDYAKIRSEIHVRIVDLPSLDYLRDLRYTHLNTLVRVSGVVTRRSGVFPQLKLVKYDCLKCGALLGPFVQDSSGQEEIKIGNCSECSSKGPFNVNAAQTVYRNHQRLTLQESPGSVPAGRLPRHKEIVLLWDLIDSARPGDEIEVTGVYRNNFSYALNTKNGFPVFSTIIEANYISKKEDTFAAVKLTEDDVKAIRNAAADPLIAKRIFASVSPSIYGHESIKTAIALSLFGGVPKNINGKHNIRGDINVLLLGDPGTAKSQFLKWTQVTAHRSVFTTGQGASAVGLTASVRKDPVTREWTLEGGALVLADKGVCLIDEFDKMNDHDRTSIHEAMEQQSISISKAGIVTTLSARCSIIAAANPIRGRYNPALPFSKNVELTEPILSRFDILCVVKDTVDPLVDEKLASFVVGSHVRSHPCTTAKTLQEEDTWISEFQSNKGTNAFADIEPLSQDFLKKYIIYAKSHIVPQLSQVDMDKVSRLYADLRKESLASGSVPITARHIEAIIRISEATAKMHLRNFVRSEDVDLAIRVVLESFISAQKFSVMKSLKKSFNKYISYMKDSFELAFFVLQELVRDTLRYYHYKYSEESMPKAMQIEVADFENKIREINLNVDLSSFYNSRYFTSNGYRYRKGSGNNASYIEKDI